MRARTRKLLLILIATLVLALPASAPSMIEADRYGLHIQVKPLGYNEVVSLYLGRGLEGPVIERYARRCVLRVLLRNVDSKARISTAMDEWVVRTSGQSPRRIQGRSHWIAEIDRSQPSQEARMVFEWSQLPEVIGLDAGDSVQGLVSLPLQRGIEFDLVIHWRSGGRSYEQSIRRIDCS